MRTFFFVTIFFVARAATATELLWLDNLSASRSTALRNAFFTLDLASQKQIDAGKKGDWQTRVQAVYAACSCTLVAIRGGKDDAVIAVDDAAGYRSTPLHLSEKPSRPELLAFVNYSNAPPENAPTPARAPALVSPPPPAMVQTAPPIEEPKPPEPPWQTHLLDFSFGGGSISRKLTLQNIATNNMASYSLNVAGAISGRLAAAPLALTHYKIVRDWQIYGELGGAPGFASTDPNTGGQTTTHWFYWRAGLALHFKLGDNLPVITPDVSYGGEVFEFTAAGVPVSQLPSASYLFARFGGSIEQSLGPRWKLGVVGAFRWVQSGGYLATRFSGTQILGYDVGGEVTMKIWRGFYAQLVGGYVRYGYTLKPKQTDPYVATGAIDELPYGAIRLGYQI